MRFVVVLSPSSPSPFSPRGRKPLALMIGVEGQDIEDILTVGNPDFWRLVEERRAQPTLGEAELRKRLALAPAAKGGSKPIAKRAVPRRTGRRPPKR